MRDELIRTVSEFLEICLSRSDATNYLSPAFVEDGGEFDAPWFHRYAIMGFETPKGLNKNICADVLLDLDGVEYTSRWIREYKPRQVSKTAPWRINPLSLKRTRAFSDE